MTTSILEAILQKEALPPAEKTVPANVIPEVQSGTAETQNFRQQMGHISRQSIVFFAGTIFTAAAGYLFKVYLARALGAEPLGVYALGMTIVGFLGMFGALGFPQSAVRFVATYTATAKLDLLRGFLGRSVVLLLVSNLLLGAVVLLLGPWISIRFYHTPSLNAYLGWFALLMIFSALNAFLGQVLAGYKDVARRTVITNFVGSPVMMVLTLALLASGLGLRGYILAQLVGAVVVLILLLAVVWRITPQAARSFSAGLPTYEKEVISFSAAVFGVGFLEFSMAQADKVLIGFYLDAREVGIYAMAAAFVTFVPIMLQTVNQIFSPTIADLYARGQHALLGRIFQTLTKWILGLTLPLAGGMIIFAAPLMRIFGHDFERGWPILIIGALGQLVNCGVGSVGYLLLMSGNQSRLIRIQAVAACVMVALNLALIPRWGITGAAVGSAVTNVFANVWYLREVRRALGLSPYNRSYLRLLPPLAGGLMVLLLLKAKLGAVRPEWIVISAGLLLAYTAFIGVALAVGLDADDRLIARAVWSRARAMFPGAEANA
jgi:O-antigen/teichoic acid export membrane protein